MIPNFKLVSVCQKYRKIKWSGFLEQNVFGTSCKCENAPLTSLIARYVHRFNFHTRVHNIYDATKKSTRDLQVKTTVSLPAFLHNVQQKTVNR